MTTFRAGDVIGECADPKCDGAIVYSGGNSASCQRCGSTYNVDFDEDEQQEEVPETPQAPVAPEMPAPTPLPVAPTATPPAPVVPEARPIPQPAPVEPEGYAKQPEEATFGTTIPLDQGPTPGLAGPATAQPVEPIIDGEAIGKLTEAVAGSPDARKKQLNLDPEQVEINLSVTNVNLPDYVRKSRPWKWGQVMSRTGNPYRQNTKSWQIFNIIHEHECTIEEVVKGYVANGYDVSRMNFLLTIYDVVTHCVAAGLLLIDPETRIIGVCKTLPQATEMP